MSAIVEIVEMPMFNASIAVTELLMKTLENCAKELASRCITEAASRHGFNASDEIRCLGLENLTLIRKQMAKKSVALKKEKNQREKVVKDNKSLCPMPFVAANVDDGGCKGLAYNRGLFTQCAKKRMENGNFCKVCQSEADKNVSGCPDCGTVASRLVAGLYEFKDPKGRSPVSYLKVLEKLKFTQEAALEEAGKLNIEIPEDHFAVLAVEKSKKSSVARGRPCKLVKKTGAIEADNVSDLFAKLTAEDDEEFVTELFAKSSSESDEENVEEKPVKSKNAKLTAEEKAAKKAALEEERALKKAEREEKKSQEKAEREAKKSQEKAEREEKLAKEKAEREEKLAKEKAEREEKLAKEKAEREEKLAKEKAEREAKKSQEKAEKEAAKSSKGNKAPEGKVAKSEDPKPAAKPVAKPAPGKVSVTRIQIGGNTYWKSSANILYDPSTQEEVGLWDPESKTIKELHEDDEEVEEEDYESDA